MIGEQGDSKINCAICQKFYGVLFRESERGEWVCSSCIEKCKTNEFVKNTAIWYGKNYGG